MKTVKTDSLINTGIALIFESLVPALAFYAPLVAEVVRHVASRISQYKLHFAK